jgi:outer membrane lipoprotein-sorting protein
MLPSRTLSRGITMLALLMALPLQALQSGPVAPVVGEGWTIESLMAALALQPAGEARYTEIKTLASLKQPLVTEGVLRYRYPDSLEKSAEKPRAERFVIRGDAMEIYRDGKLKRQVLLAGYPALQNFVNSFIATVGGDLEALRKYYELSLDGSKQGWTLLLTPIDTELQRVVKHITVRGKEGMIESFETLQPNDDRSVMLITPLG